MIHALAPGATVIDVTHAVDPYDVLQAAAVLADAVPYLPVGVHVAVVDPGVGTQRRAVALTCEDGRAYVGPDNGVLMLAASRSGIHSGVELRSPSEGAAGVTFAGRDVFAPAAARLAIGAAPLALGEPIAVDSLVPLSVPPAMTEAGGLRVLVLSVDRFGTLQLACSRQEFAALGSSAQLLVTTSEARIRARRARTFSDVAVGSLLVYEDSFGRMSVAVREGSAAEQLAAAAGDWISLGAE